MAVCRAGAVALAGRRRGWRGGGRAQAREEGLGKLTLDAWGSEKRAHAVATVMTGRSERGRARWRRRREDEVGDGDDCVRVETTACA